MKTSQTKTKRSDDKSWIFIVLLLLGVGFVFLSQTTDPKKEVQLIHEDPERIKRVDTHLKDTAFNLEADRRQRQIEAYQQLNKLKSSNSQTPYVESKDFTLETDPYMQSLTQELDRSQQPHPDNYTPEEIVQQRLYENEQLNKASEAYRQAYAEQFIENARRGGWEIELGPNFEVLSVKKLKERRGPSLFNESDFGGSR